MVTDTVGNVYCDLQYDCAYIPTKMERNLLFLAYRLSLESNNKNGRHAAIIIDEQDNILSVSVNKISHGVSRHAEIGAIEEFNLSDNLYKTLHSCRMLVVRGNFFGDVTHSKPCLKCYNSLVESGIGQIIYSVSKNEYRKIYFPKKNNST